MNKEFYICPECKYKTEMKHFIGLCPVCGYKETKAAIAERLKVAKSEKDVAKADLDDAYNAKQSAYFDMKNHDISHDDFQEYVACFHVKKSNVH